MPDSTENNSRLEAWRYLSDADGASLLNASKECLSGDVAGISRLRRNWTLHQVSAALELHEARRRAVGKFERPQTILSDRIGIEQATGTTIAIYKAGRLHDLGVRTITDLCCGIGGDAMAFATKMTTLGIDLDPVKAWMAGKNAECDTRCEDAIEAAIHSEVIHIDPARRDPERGIREHDPSGWSPDEQSLKLLLEQHPNAAVKMGPGVNVDELTFRPAKSEVEFISMDGNLKQAVLWTGSLAETRHRATRCSTDGHMSIHSNHAEPALVDEPRWRDSWLHVPDPSVERARLLGLLCKEWKLAEPASGLGLLLGDERARTPWLTPYRVAEQMPWRLDRIKDWLRQHDAGQVEIRTRGRAISDIDSLRSDLLGKGDRPWTVFGLRLGKSRIAVVTYPRGHEDR